MQKKIILRIRPEEIGNDLSIKQQIANQASVKLSAITGYQMLKKSVDARGKQIVFNISLNAFINEPFHRVPLHQFNFKDVSTSPKSVVIIGAGPAGLFAALKLIENGIKPILLERGKDVKSRRRDYRSTTEKYC